MGDERRMVRRIADLSFSARPWQQIEAASSTCVWLQRPPISKIKNLLFREHSRLTSSPMSDEHFFYHPRNCSLLISLLLRLSPILYAYQSGQPWRNSWKTSLLPVVPAARAGDVKRSEEPFAGSIFLRVTTLVNCSTMGKLDQSRTPLRSKRRHQQNQAS